MVVQNCGTAGENCGTAGENCGTAGENCGTAGENCGTAGENCCTAGENCGTAGEKWCKSVSAGEFFFSTVIDDVEAGGIGRVNLSLFVTIKSNK